MPKRTVGVLGALAALLLAGAAGAQVCAGLPSGDGGVTLGGRKDFPEGTDSWGIETSYNFHGPFSLFAGVDVFTENDFPGREIFRGGVAVELPGVAVSPTSGAPACLMVEAAYVDQDFLQITEVPIGLGLGIDLSSPSGVALLPYVIPQLVITSLNFDSGALPQFSDETEFDFGARGGALVTYGKVYLGGEFRHVFADGADPAFGIRAGIRF